MFLPQGKRSYFTLSLIAFKQVHSVNMGYTQYAATAKLCLLTSDAGAWFRLLPVSKNKDSGYLRNVSTYIPKDAPSHPKRQETALYVTLESCHVSCFQVTNCVVCMGSHRLMSRVGKKQQNTWSSDWSNLHSPIPLQLNAHGFCSLQTRICIWFPAERKGSRKTE